MSKVRGLVWLRQDLRLRDNPALMQAARECDELVLLFVHDQNDTTVSRLGAASQAWLHASLLAFATSLEKFDQRLDLLSGEAELLLPQLVSDSSIHKVYWNRCYDPVSVARDKRIKSRLGDVAEVYSHNGLLLAEPWQAGKADGTPYRVFTPYWRRLVTDLPGDAPLPLPRQLPPPPRRRSPGNQRLAALGLLPSRNWHKDMLSSWTPGEAGAQQRLKAFVRKQIDFYADERDLPATAGTSRLSPHLHFGELSVRAAMHMLHAQCDDVGIPKSGAETFARELGWRDFAYHLIYHFPETVTAPLDQRFAEFPWAEDTAEDLRAWQRGLTGVPIVDAGMRELWHTGWMHNRVRMVVASFLVKNLLIPWQQGEQWFRDTLVDADLASNVLGWQWAAGCGADAAPYFRVFNPVLQGEKFDKQGEYVQRWIPELAAVPQRYIHQPWSMPDIASVAPDYPPPRVDLKQSRARALNAFDQIKRV